MCLLLHLWLRQGCEQMRLCQGCVHCIVRDRLAGHRHARDIMGKVAATSRFNSRARPSTTPPRRAQRMPTRMRVGSDGDGGRVARGRVGARIKKYVVIVVVINRGS